MNLLRRASPLAASDVVLTALLLMAATAVPPPSQSHLGTTAAGHGCAPAHPPPLLR